MNCFLLIILALSGEAPAGWQSFETGSFTVIHTDESRALAERVSPVLSPSLLRISDELGTDPPQGINVVVCPDQRTFRELQGGRVEPWVSGTAYPSRRLIYLRPLSGRDVRHSSIESVAAHEIAHVVLHHKLGDVEPPRWLDEGLAVYMGREPLFSRVELLVPIGLTGRSIPFRSLQQEFPESPGPAATAYAESGDFVRFLMAYQGSGYKRFMDYIELMSRGADPDNALQAAYGKSLFDLETEWLKHVRRTYGFLSAVSGGALLWFLIAVLAILAYTNKKAGARRRMEALEREDGLYGHEMEAEAEDEEGRFTGLH